MWNEIWWPAEFHSTIRIQISRFSYELGLSGLLTEAKNINNRHLKNKFARYLQFQPCTFCFIFVVSGIIAIIKSNREWWRVAASPTCKSDILVMGVTQIMKYDYQWASAKNTSFSQWNGNMFCSVSFCLDRSCYSPWWRHVVTYMTRTSLLLQDHIEYEATGMGVSPRLVFGRQLKCSERGREGEI